jgi:MFS family permease
MRLPRAALISRDYTRLWLGQAISTLGDYVFSTTLVLWIATKLAAGKPWAPVAVSGEMLAMGAAVLLAGPLAGVFVDRWNRRSTMLGTEVIRGVLAGLLTALSFVPIRDLPVGVWLGAIYLVVFALNGVGQFFSPARFATIGDVVTSKEDRTRAASIGQATSATVAIVGPPLAAPLLFVFGPQWALLFNTASYLVSFVAIRSIQAGRGPRADRQSASRSGFWTEFADGLRFFVGNKLLVTLLLIALISQIGTGALNALNVFFVTGNLHVPASLYGYLGTAIGVGSICGAIFAGRVSRRLGLRATVYLGLLLSGVLVIAYSRQTIFAAAAALFFLLAIPLGVINTAMTPLLLGAVPKEYLGRMMAVMTPALRLGSMLSVVVASWLASSALRNFDGTVAGVRFGAIDLIFAGSGVMMIVAAGYAVFALREVATPGSPAAVPDSPATAADSPGTAAKP